VSAFLGYVLNVRSTIFFSALAFFIFVAFRFETGYDWPVYKEIFATIGPLCERTADGAKYYSELFHQEPTFVAFLSFLRCFGADYQLVVIFVAFFQVVVFSIFLRKVSYSASAVFAISAVWLIFSLYFSVVRQGIAVGVFMLFMLAFFARAYIRAALLLLVALLFQYSSLMYLIAWWLARFLPGSRYLYILFSLALVISLLGISVWKPILELSMLVPNDLIASKAEYYRFEREVRVSGFDVVFVYVSALSLGLFSIWRYSDIDNDILKKICGMAIILTFVNILFVDFPLIRNRMMYLIFPFYFIVLFDYFKTRRQSERAFVLAVVMISSLSYYTLFLTKPTSLVLVPYQSYIYHKLTGEPGTGHERQEIMRAEFNEKRI